MKAILYVISLAITGAAVFFSNQNLGKFKEQQEIRKDLTDRSRAVSREGDKKLEEVTSEKETLTAAKNDKATLEASLESLKADERQLTRAVAELEGQLESQKEKFAELDKLQKELEGVFRDLPGGITLENIPSKVEELKTELENKKRELAEVETGIEAAERAVEGNRADIVSLAEREANRNRRFRANAMQSVVTAVNHDYGFVVIGAGSNTGFTPQTRLLIQRGGRLVGEVKPSSIEPSQTIAEIDEDTLAPGARIQPGDTVILAVPASN